MNTFFRNIISLEKQLNVDALGVYINKNNNSILGNKNINLLSRNRLYYGQFNILEFCGLEKEYNLCIADNDKISTLIVLENVINILSTVWYKLYKVNYEVACPDVNSVYFKLKELTKKYLLLLSGQSFNTQIDWEYWKKYVIRNWTYVTHDMRYCELDNKFTIIKQVMWIREVLRTCRNCILLFPLYGAFYLKLFFDAIEDIYPSLKFIKSFFLNIGFHDNQSKYESIHNIISLSDSADFKTHLPHNEILVVDDNIGSGMTLMKVSEILLSLGFECKKMVCEVPWKAVIRTQNISTIQRVLDYPTLKECLIIGSINLYVKKIISNTYDLLQPPKIKYFDLETALSFSGWSSEQRLLLEREFNFLVSLEDNASWVKYN